MKKSARKKPLRQPTDREKAALAMNFLLASMTLEQVKLFLSRDLRQWIDFLYQLPAQGKPTRNRARL